VSPPELFMSDTGCDGGFLSRPFQRWPGSLIGPFGAPDNRQVQGMRYVRLSFYVDSPRLVADGLPGGVPRKPCEVQNARGRGM